jgi:hypothetical protein
VLGPFQHNFPNTSTLPELTGNSEFTVINGLVWVIGETENSDSDFAWYYSADYGSTFTKGGQFSFSQPNLAAFDPAICTDSSGFIHIIGTVSGYTGNTPNDTTSVVKFTLDAGPLWQPNTFYPLNSKVVDSFGNVQINSVAGTSGNSAPSWGTGITIDNGIVWFYSQPALAGPFSMTTG